MISSKRRIRFIKDNLKIHGLNISVCLGIYNIETTYRKFLFRTCENAFFILNFIANKLFKCKIKNITIGVFQIGLTSILKCNGYSIWQYYDYLQKMTFNQFVCVVKAMFFKNNVKIFCKKVSAYGTDYEDINRMIAKYGKLYNGSVNYILMLSNEYNKLEKIS